MSSTAMKILHTADKVRYAGMSTEELRASFLLEGLFSRGRLQFSYVDLDRAVVGGVVPLASPIVLEASPELRSEHFCDRRELGVLNLGGEGAVLVDGEEYKLSKLDCLYAGRGARSVSFASSNPQSPAIFYLLSYPAHANHPTSVARFADLTPLRLGSIESCNQRSVYKAIYGEGIRSCQLVMGFTLLERGSDWNTMPAHTHLRRSEIYCYFDLDAAQRVIHLMGAPQETRHLVVSNHEAVVSPSWSIHAGVGTAAYGFCWGMGGENQAYDDMDPVQIADLR